MKPDGVNNQRTVYDIDYKKDIQPKDEQNTRSLFNALWDEAGNMLEYADANGDGTIDQNDIPKLQQLLGMLKDAQYTISKHVKKFSFDVENFKKGFGTCEKNLQNVIASITDGTYISPKESAEKAAKAKQEAEAASQSIGEPSETDAERPKPKTLQEEIRYHSYDLEETWTPRQRGESNGAYKNYIAVMSLFRQGLYEKAYKKCESILQLFGSERIETGDVSIKMSKEQTNLIQNMGFALLKLCKGHVDTNDKSEGTQEIVSQGLSDKERAKVAHQKKHTPEDFINDLIRNGYTKEHAMKVAKENGII